jgi:uncharacterized protein (TIGR03000 family)
MAAPPEKGPPPAKQDDKGEVSRARLIVQVPADAKLYIDDQQMRTTSNRRVFNTPSLQRGETYYYILRAEVVRNGQTVSQTRRVLLRAGEVVNASFNELRPAPAATVQVSSGSR